jgi:hypothetical protein
MLTRVELSVHHVTDPSGAMLLSSDAPDERVVRVAGGVIVAYLSTTHFHPLTPMQCPDSVAVGLSPFDDTPNPGGEYKLWMTPATIPLTDNFLPRNSKTDNFKVVPPDGGDGD